MLLVCTRDNKKKRLLLLHRVELSAGCEVQELPYGLEQPNGFAIKHSERGRVELTFEAEYPADEWRRALLESLTALRDLQSRQGRPSAATALAAKKSLAVTRRVSTPAMTSPPVAVTGASSPGVPLERVKTASVLERRTAALGGSGGGWRRGTVGSVNDLAKPAKPVVFAAPAKAEEEDEDEDEEEHNSLEDSPMVFRKKPSASPRPGGPAKPAAAPAAAAAPAPAPAAPAAGADDEDEGEVVHW